MMESQGLEVTGHRTAMVNPGLFREGLVARPARVGEIIRNALREMGVDRCPVLGAVPGFQSALHVLELPKARGLDPREFIPREASRTLGVAPAVSILAWHQMPDWLGRTRWVVASTTRRSLASYLDTLQSAGLRLRAVDLRAFALARAVGQSEAVIAYSALDGVEVVIVKEWTPVACQSSVWGSEPVEEAVLMDRLTDIIERTIGSYDQRHPEAPLSEDTPLYLCGSAPGSETDLGPQLADTLGRSAGELSIPMVAPEDFPVRDFVVNVGLALREA
ncbi:MAG: hypothetical protein Q8O40_05525 [Chloroflexota bacterium]|nr:hypothetical protein [Chloroflexota bacterium]